MHAHAHALADSVAVVVVDAAALRRYNGNSVDDANDDDDYMYIYLRAHRRPGQNRWTNGKSHQTETFNVRTFIQIQMLLFHIRLTDCLTVWLFDCCFRYVRTPRALCALSIPSDAQFLPAQIFIRVIQTINKKMVFAQIAPIAQNHRTNRRIRMCTPPRGHKRSLKNNQFTTLITFYLFILCNLYSSFCASPVQCPFNSSIVRASNGIAGPKNSHKINFDFRFRIGTEYSFHS